MSHAAALSLEQIHTDFASPDARRRNASFAALREVFSRMLQGELRRGRHTLTHDVFEDVLQELLLSAWSKDLPRFDPARGNLAAFLRRRVRWSLIDVFRAGRVDVALDDVELDEVPTTHDEDTAEGVLIDLERARQVKEAAAAVCQAARHIEDKKARKAVWHYDVLGESMKDVARRLRVHASNAGRARQRGLMALRAAVPELAYAA